ncbi:Tripartite motif-containing protein 2-like [Oopsacas minuta]|uniref:Tripartite motif-containing protein 2-like n=1 Tax=Oopsacas minuta TaxID=111878 RepID=A0AAV7JCW1_9METZ|nr:Tripartite motif-containing protein 2-like [Oopsacas minuta]
MDISEEKSLNKDMSPLVYDTLTCVHCKKFKRTSKFLKCNHVICPKCLSVLSANGCIECTICGLLTPIPNGEVDLEDNFMALHCINKKDVLASIGSVLCNSCCLGKSTPSELFCVQCNRYMCKIDWNAHKNFVPGASYHVSINKDITSDSDTEQFLIQTSVSQHCRDHPNYNTELYCTNCRILTCANCLVVNHKDHIVVGMNVALESELADFSKCKESLEEKIDTCKQILQQSEQKKGSLEEKRDFEKGRIDKEYEEKLALIVKTRDDELLQLRTEYDDVINTLFIQTQQLESSLNQLYQAIRLTQTCSALAQCKEDQLTLIPKITDRLVSLSETIPKQKPIQSELHLGTSPSLHSPNVVKLKYSLETIEPTHKIGDNINLNKTRAIVSGDNDEIFVVDKGNSLIHSFSPEGKQLRAFGSYGRGPGQFKSPWGLCLDGKRLFVSDTSIGIVMSFTIEGTYRSKFGAWGQAAGEFRSPKGICTDSIGCLWVADCDNNRIQRFDQEGKHLDIFPHNKSFVMTKPVDVKTALYDNTLWVLTGCSPAVLHISSEGEVLDQIATLGKGRELSHPVSICYDNASRCVLVTDTSSSCVMVFSETGVVEGRLTFQDVKSYALHGVTVDRAGRVLCTAKCIQVFVI